VFGFQQLSTTVVALILTHLAFLFLLASIMSDVAILQSVMWGLRPAKTDENRPEPSDTPQWLERRD